MKPHVFSDVLAQVPPGSYDPNASLEDRTRDICEADLCQRQFCHTHGTLCPTLTPVDIDVSGLPCQDNSPCNGKRKFQFGPRFNVYVVWAKKHRRLRTPLLVLENVPEPQF